MRSTQLPSPARSRILSRRRLAGGAVGAALLLAACGGGSDSASDGESLSDVEAEEGAGSEATGEATPVAAGTGYVDLVGPDVVATAEIETNLLPSVVVDDLTNSRKVNFRNLVPQEKPVLLWMYAPH